MSSLALGYTATALCSSLLLAAAWRRPRFARLPFALLFLAASAFNVVTALRDPGVYVTGFAPHAFPPARELIERVVALAPDAIVLAIAAAQAAFGLGLAIGRGVAFHAGVVGATCFLVGISWLGAGAAFPLNLVLAAGVLLLLRRQRGLPR
jgi:hypothetical protein